MKNLKYNVIGLMSGTSLDGLDIALCKFSKSAKAWKYEIQKTKTIAYSKAWKEKLGNAHLLSVQELCKLNTEFGKFIGEHVLKFILRNKIKNVDLISSHGHTVFHQPQNKFTLQIGDGASIAAITGIKTVCDFRSLDVALGGQGAPLVPIGDELLFTKYDACLNIGGIANISFKSPPNLKGAIRRTEEVKGKRLAFDICPANMVFNYLSKQSGQDYDKGGKIAVSGKLNDNLFQQFNSLPFYKNYKSKSLGREWIEENFIAVLISPAGGGRPAPKEGRREESHSLSIADKLATASEHAAFQTARVLNNFKIKNVLVTGGGAYNTDLLNRISAYTDCHLHIPDDKTIQFKEALIFAFLGVLRLRNEINTLKEVTGAKRDSCGGTIYSGISKI